MGILVNLVKNEGHRLTFPDHCPPWLTSLMQQCAAENPKDRPGMQQVRDNFIPVDVLDITDADLLASWGAAMAVVACVSLECGLLNAASFPHIFMNAFKDVLAIAVELEGKLIEALSKKVGISAKDLCSASSLDMARKQL